MGLPGHRRTSSHKRRRASHFALKSQNLTTDSKTGTVHQSHRAAPGATEYRGHAIHVKGKDKKLDRLLKKSGKTKTAETESKEK
ncbi:MAG: 50S ribosomal protein L32 [Patescibacteria group bacterium]